MAETKDSEMSDSQLETLLRSIHPIPKTQDGNCPHIQWMGYDLAHCPGVGDWKCMAQEFACGDYGGCTDYHDCNSSDHNSCSVYLKSKKI